MVVTKWERLGIMEPLGRRCRCNFSSFASSMPLKLKQPVCSPTHQQTSFTTRTETPPQPPNTLIHPKCLAFGILKHKLFFSPFPFIYFLFLLPDLWNFFAAVQTAGQLHVWNSAHSDHWERSKVEQAFRVGQMIRYVALVHQTFRFLR